MGDPPQPRARPAMGVPAEAPSLLQISQLNALITLLIGNLSAGDRTKIMTICTIDVHARDVVAKMITAKARAPGRAGNPAGGWCLGLPRTPPSQLLLLPPGLREAGDTTPGSGYCLLHPLSQPW